MTAHEQELLDLHDFFQTAKFPDVPFKLNKYITIVADPRVFINMEILRIEDYVGPDPIRDSLFRHFRELKELCSKQDWA